MNIMLWSYVTVARNSIRSSDWYYHGALYGAVLTGMLTVGGLAMYVIGAPADAEVIQAQHRRQKSS